MSLWLASDDRDDVTLLQEALGYATEAYECSDSEEPTHAEALDQMALLNWHLGSLQDSLDLYRLVMDSGYGDDDTRASIAKINSELGAQNANS